MEWTRGEFVISDDKARLKVSEIAVLMKQGYWCSHYTPEKIARLLETSFWMGLFNRNKKLIGFARLITDRETVTLITDLLVHKDYRNQGHGAWLMACLLEHPELKETSMSLGTQDGDQFFEKYGFERQGAQMHRAPNTPPPPPPPPLPPQPRRRRSRKSASS